MLLPATIDQVLEALDTIINETIANNSYLGIFAYVYRRTTAQIKAEVESGAFDDNERMQRMDVLFANLYIKAYRDFKLGKPVSQCWALSFNSARDRLALIQHLMLGMNAHINLDLGIAASAVMEGKPIGQLAHDFRKVNDVLASITNEIQSRLGRVSPLMFVLDWIGHRSDEKVIDFSVKAAREGSWIVAKELWDLTGNDREIHIVEIDSHVAQFGERLRNPKSRFLQLTLKVIVMFEPGDVPAIIRSMRDENRH